MNQSSGKTKKQQEDYNFHYTGIPPVYGKCAGVNSDGIITSLPQVRLNSNRKGILDYFNNSWTLNEVLFSGLISKEAFYIRPYHKLRHPMIFYYGHTAVVYINKLRVAGIITEAVNAEFEQIFEVGVDEMRWDDMHEGNQNIWPELEEVRIYRKKVYDTIRSIIETHHLLDNDKLPITQDSPMWSLVMGFEHERIHLETSSVLMREMPLEYLKKPKQWPNFITSERNPYQKNELINIQSGSVSLGKENNIPTFGWDNEYGSETRYVRSFSASKFLVSNGEFLEFVKDGGYSKEKYWSLEGWQWRRFGNIKWPTFWVQNGPAGSHLYKLRTIFEVIDMQLNWPVCVNFYEAKAYCAWLSERDNTNTPCRLITEAEHNAIRDTKKHEQNLNLKTGAESPVDYFPANDKGFYDVFGNLWQWCEDHFHPLSESTPHPYYDDFSTPCYDGEHQMILGGSFISTGDEASIYARFHFRPHFFQHAGFRISRNTDGNPSCDAVYINKSDINTYESEEMLNRYMLMHWGSEKDIWENIPKSSLPMPKAVNLPLKCAEFVAEYCDKFDNVLDVGCAVGRSSFELTKNFAKVTAIDYSREFIDAANKLKTAKKLSYRRKDSGSSGKILTATVDENINTENITFELGDACDLPHSLGSFDAVLLANTLCRLPEPKKFLHRVQGKDAIVKKGGILVMTTPFSWLEEYTAKENWLSGIEDIKNILSEFELLHTEELPFMIREHRRKFEYIITLASVWKRK